MSNPASPFSVVKPTSLAAEAVGNRAVQEIQASLVIAKKFPRDENAAYESVLNACKRRSLAEIATYAFSRGGTAISGPSIDLMETICRSWGNCQTGVVELDRRQGESTVLAFAWDMQTNFYDQKTFNVKHWRDTKEGGYELKDERDIYEAIANQGARRKRACMEAIVPQYLIDDAVAQCEKTLKDNSEALGDRSKKMLVALAEYGVTQLMIEKRLQHKLEAITEKELVLLRKIYVSLRDDMSKPEAWFEITQTTTPGATVAKKSDAKEEAKQTEQGLGPVKAPSMDGGIAAAPAGVSAQASPPASAPTPPEVRKRRSKATMVEEPLDPVPTAPAAPLAESQPPVQAVSALTGYDAEDPASVSAVIRAALGDFAEEELMSLLQKGGVAKPSQKYLENLATMKLEKICATWPALVAEMTLARIGDGNAQ